MLYRAEQVQVPERGERNQRTRFESAMSPVLSTILNFNWIGEPKWIGIKNYGEWCLFDKEGNGVIGGETLRDILSGLIWMDC